MSKWTSRYGVLPLQHIGALAQYENDSPYSDELYVM